MDFSSAELSDLAEHIPVAAADRGLLFMADAEFNKEPDVELSAAAVTLDSALALAVGSQAPFITVSETKFYAQQFRAVLTDPGHTVLAPKAEDAIAKAGTHEGEIKILKLRWLAHGFMFEWAAVADWYSDLWRELSEPLLQPGSGGTSSAGIKVPQSY